MPVFDSDPAFWRDRLKASGIHLGLSVGTAAIAALLVFGVWYPAPYREISGGRELFLLVVAVDVIMGPLITLAVFNRTKPWSELRRDLIFVGVMQFAALGYGFWSVSAARPVHLVFEIDRFRMVHAVDVPVEFIEKTAPDIEPLPLTGPTVLGLRPFRDEEERLDSTIAALGGVQLAFRPDLWQPYAKSVEDVLKVAKPTRHLTAQFVEQRPAIEAALADVGRTVDDTLYLPLVGRKDFWTVFLDPVSARVLAVAPIDSL